MATGTSSRSVNWSWIWAVLVYWTYKITVTAGMVVIYVGFIADGLRRWKPTFGQRVWRIPMLSWLRDFEATYRIDFAFLAAILMAFLVCIAWSHLISAWLSEEERGTSLRERRQAAAVFLTGVVVLLGDAMLFYMTCVQAGWSGTKMSVGALTGTVVYVAVILMVNLIGVNLKAKVDEAR